MRHWVQTARAIAAVSMGVMATGAATACLTHHAHGLAAWLQLAQAAETTPGASGSAEVAETVLDEQDVMSVLGLRVRSSAGEDMGRIVNVIVDRTGQVRAAVIDFGGFLGVGNRKIAIDWNALHFATAANRDDRITLDLTRDQVKAAPEYKEGRPLVVLGTAESLQPAASSQ